MNILHRYSSYLRNSTIIRHCTLYSHRYRNRILIGSVLLSLSAGFLNSEFEKFTLPTHPFNEDAEQDFYTKHGRTFLLHNAKPFMYSIIGINTIVFLCWKLNPLLMSRHFLTSHKNMIRKRYHSILLSNWSHMNWWHLAINMYVLNNFGSIMIETMGVLPFITLYVGAGISGSLLSLLRHSKTRQFAKYASLGASASLFGVIVAFSLNRPQSMVKFIGTPDTWTFPAQKGIIGLMAIDIIGLLMGWRFLDHAAHLGGALFGFVFWKLMANPNICSIHTSDLPCVLPSHLQNDEDDIEQNVRNANQIFMRGNYIFEGKYNNFMPDDVYGKIYGPLSTYCGQVFCDQTTESTLYHGFGCLRSEITGSIFVGEFENGFIKGCGFLFFDDGRSYPVKYDRESNSYVRLTKYDPSMSRLLNQQTFNRLSQKLKSKK